MRLLHSSDWHLGRPLEGHSRQAEQEQFVTEFCEIAAANDVDLVLIAGDVFDTYNPPAWAEQLFCTALDRLAQGGSRGVVVIAGNHDSPDRLSAVRPLALNQGIVILGLPLEHARGSCSVGDDRVSTLAAGPGWVELSIPGCRHSAVISLLPYPSEARLARLLSSDLEEHSLRDAYSRAVSDIFLCQAANYRADTVNLAVSHLFVQGGSATDSERPIEVGGACTVAADHLPATAQYIALGHLHRPQQVKQAAVSAFYSGSPLAYSFSEANQSKVVYLVDLQPGGEADVTPIPLRAGIPLQRWICPGGLTEAWDRIAAAAGKPAWVELELHLPQFISNEEVIKLRQAWPTLVSIRTVLASDEPAQHKERLDSLGLPEIFDRFYRQRRAGSAPPPELVQMFIGLANSAAVSSAEGGEGE